MSCHAGPYNRGIVTNGLVLYYDVNEPVCYSSGRTDIQDLSRNGNAGTLVNGVGYSSNNGGSLVFDGINDYIQLSRPSQLVTGGQITICLWAKWTTTGTTTSTIQLLIDNNHSSSPIRGFVIQDRPDLNKSLTFGALGSPSDSLNGVVSTFQVGDGNWHHIAGTNNGSKSILYIDGIYNNQINETGLATVQPTITLGKWQGGTRYLNGNIPNIQIYNRALSATEIQQNFNATRGRFGI